MWGVLSPASIITLPHPSILLGKRASQGGMASKESYLWSILQTKSSGKRSYPRQERTKPRYKEKEGQQSQCERERVTVIEIWSMT